VGGDKKLWKKDTPLYFSDSGGASRFYYVAKASRREREAGLEGCPPKAKANQYGDGLNSATKIRTDEQAEHGVDRGGARNIHPTVKPLALMRWLCRLVTPPGGLILDPFTGSGSTGCAAVLEGFRFLGIEREAEYVAIAERRITHWAATVQPDLEPAA
jgi:site-specific DNA-methyltransferase (adenine-specific)